ncbi:hypothetical protein [Nakamurella aerolata]|uniref:Uncharacterized protein n=1 Tax=Nakamurella aerolata TaxID=1656892 RepID=A0A849A681_9ACTN|nr:hypothetical protein [Nakamurella aerolata]NNG34923.1 hypothetical protein [Nakamurella aerolata]
MSNPEEPRPEDDITIGPPLRCVEASIPVVGDIMAQIGRFLGLLRWAIEYAMPPKEAWFPNTIAAVACFSRAYQGLQASTWLALHGFYTEARIAIRSVYESAGLARMLAHDTELAEKWLHRGDWVPDRNSRSYADAMTGGEGETYREYYKRASTIAHPAAISTLPFVLTAAGEPNLTWGPAFDESSCLSVLKEIAIEAAFVCFAFRIAAVDEAAIDPAWLRDLADLSREVTGERLEHLDRDWDAMTSAYEEFRAHVQHDDALDATLEEHPNSMRNVRDRIRRDIPDD